MESFWASHWGFTGDSLVFWWGPKEGPKKGTLSGIRKSEIWLYYLVHFSKIRNLRKGHFGGTILESMWGQNHENRDSVYSERSVSVS